MNGYRIDSRPDRQRLPLGFRVIENACIWMKAGVIGFRECDNHYDCSTCAFDKGMQRTMALDPPKTSAEEPKWVNYLKRRYDGASRPCRHVLTGRVDAPKICSMNYECYHCAFDQMLDDDLGGAGRPVYRKAGGYHVADDYYYHMGHSWARLEHGGRVRIGLDDFLVRLCGAPTCIDLPPLGETLLQDQVGLAISRGSHQAAVLAPVSGTVLAVNHNVRRHPEMPHVDPYHEGWLVVVEPIAVRKALKVLYYGTTSLKWMERESDRLLKLIGPHYDQLAATGGRAIADVFGQFPGIGWERLVAEFLHTRIRTPI